MLGFRRRRRPALVAALARRPRGTVVVLRSRRAVRRFLATCPASAPAPRPTATTWKATVSNADDPLPGRAFPFDLLDERRQPEERLQADAQALRSVVAGLDPSEASWGP